MAKQQPLEVIQRERLGRVQRWEFYRKPVRGRSSEQQAYERGFRARVQDWNQGVDVPVTVQFRRAGDRQAYELGYADAKAQELAQ